MPSAVGHRGVGAAAAAAATLVIGLGVPAVRFGHRRGKSSSGPCEACGVGYFFLGAVLLFLLVIMIYQPHVFEDSSPNELVCFDPRSVGHSLLVEGSPIHVVGDIFVRVRQLGHLVPAPRAFPLILPHAARASLAVRDSDVLRELRLNGDPSLADRSSLLCIQQHVQTRDLQVPDQSPVFHRSAGVSLLLGECSRVRPAFPRSLVVSAVDRLPRCVAYHILLDSPPSGREKGRYYRFPPGTTGGVFSVHVGSRRRVQCLCGVYPLTMYVDERRRRGVPDGLSFWKREYHSRRSHLRW